jgi:hypothetical protein
MWYFLGIALCVIGAAWWLRGSVSLQKRDEYAAKHYQDEAHFHQSFQNWNHGP